SITGVKQPKLGRSSVRISKLFAKRLELIPNEKEKIVCKTAFERFRDMVEYDAPVTEITKAHFQLYINARKPHVASDTIRRELTRIYAAFTTAEEMFPVELDGYEAPPIKRPKKQKRDGVARRTISAEEKDSIVKFL